jgi:hypothetical protein
VALDSGFGPSGRPGMTRCKFRDFQVNSMF